MLLVPFWNRFLTYTMLNLLRQWDWPKVSTK